MTAGFVGAAAAGAASEEVDEVEQQTGSSFVAWLNSQFTSPADVDAKLSLLAERISKNINDNITG